MCAAIRLSLWQGDRVMGLINSAGYTKVALVSDSSILPLQATPSRLWTDRFALTSHLGRCLPVWSGTGRSSHSAASLHIGPA